MIFLINLDNFFKKKKKKIIVSPNFDKKEKLLTRDLFYYAYDRLLRPAFAVYQLGSARFVYVC